MKGKRKSRFELSEALVIEILSKLQVKSLCRINCVCKSWCSSFQTPHFIFKHYHNNLKNNNLNLLFKRCNGNTHNDIPYFSQLSTEKDEFFLVKHNIHLPFFENCVNPPQVYGPCHGLLCLQDYKEGKTALWNPSTREFKILPQSSVQPPPSPGYIYFPCVGFGFDSKTDDYKVIQFVNLVFAAHEFAYPDCEYHVELYSLKSYSWKEISVPILSPSGYHLCNNYVDGICYWKVRDLYDKHILSFDMANEKFSTLPFPEFGGSLAQYCVELLEFNGSLGVIVYPKQGTEKSFDLWIMNGAWTKQFSIESVSGVVNPLGFWKNGELFLGGSNGELVLFDPSTRELQKLGINAYPDAMGLFAYVESLIPINGRSEHEEHIIRQPAEDA